MQSKYYLKPTYTPKVLGIVLFRSGKYVSQQPVTPWHFTALCSPPVDI